MSARTADTMDKVCSLSSLILDFELQLFNTLSVRAPGSLHGT